MKLYIQLSIYIYIYIERERVFYFLAFFFLKKYIYIYIYILIIIYINITPRIINHIFAIHLYVLNFPIQKNVERFIKIQDIINIIKNFNPDTFIHLSF